jgi:hypothetical protein
VPLAVTSGNLVEKRKVVNLAQRGRRDGLRRTCAPHQGCPPARHGCARTSCTPMFLV